MYNSYNEFYKYYDEIKYDVLLACAFARSAKMMRFIDAVYDADKERFYKAYKQNERSENRFITGARLKYKLRNQKALGVIEAARKDKELAADMLKAAEKAYKHVASAIFPSKDTLRIDLALTEVLDVCKIWNNKTDDALHDAIALYFYFCNAYHLKYDYELSMAEPIKIVYEKIEAHQHPFQVVLDGFCRNLKDCDKITRILMEKTFSEVGGKTIADIGGSEALSGEHKAYFQMLWDVGQLDNLPASMYEMEKFSSAELKAIFHTIFLHVSANGIDPKKEMTRFFITCLYMRGLARAYKEAEAMVDEYAGIIRERPEQKELLRQVSAMEAKLQEEQALVADKQEKLNELQLELDRAKKKIAEQNEEIELLKEKARVLEELEAEEQAQLDEKDAAECIERAKKMKAVVFGGHPNWQAQVKEAAPGFICISADNYSFDAKIMDKADVVVVKTDYMSHAQWFKVSERARKKHKRIVYCAESVQKMMEKVGKE